VPVPAFEPDATALRIIGLLKEHYVLTDKLEPLVAALERRRVHGAYRGLQDRATFASVLTDDLRAASGDGHLSVKLGAGGRSEVGAADDWASAERRRAIHANHGFTSAQVLSGNVGYLRIAEFMEPQASLETATAAMRFVASTRALIFDLRGNPGGYAGIPEYLATYCRGGDRGECRWRQRPGPLRGDRSQTATPGSRCSAKAATGRAGPLSL
jgi:peptidase S41-like protein